MRNKLKIKFFVIFIFLLGLACFTINIAMADDTEEIKILITDFFNSLKTGDTDGIILSLTDPILNECRELLETNPGYKDQLTGVYDGIEIELGKIKIKKNDAARIDLQMKMNSGSLRKITFFCKKINGSWKISRERVIYKKK